MSLISKITARTLQAAFANYDRDTYTKQAYAALIEYYEQTDDLKLDVIALCCQWSEVDYKELVEEYTDYKVLEDLNSSCYAWDFDNDVLISQEDIVSEVSDAYTVIELDNGHYLVSE